MYTTVTVKQILDRKGFDVWSLDADMSVLDALEFMAVKNIGAVIVIENNKPVGIFSERDYARKIALKGRNERHTRLKEVMTDQVIGVEPHYELDTCLALMTDKFIRHLPVIDDESQIVGVISIGDIVKQLVAEQSFVIDQLVHYITGEQVKPPIPEPKSVELP
jgi:CBS domain-containing protein